LAGISVEKLEKRIVSVHFQSFSPQNAQIRLKKDYAIHSFFTVGQFENRCVISFHVIPGDEQIGDSIRNVIQENQNLGDVLNKFSELLIMDKSI